MLSKTPCDISTMTPTRGLISVLLLLLLSTAVYASAKDTISLSATLNKTTLSLDSTAVLTVTIVGARSADIEAPEIDGLLFQKRGQSVQTQIYNQTIASSLVVTYAVQATREGAYTIPPLKVRVGDRLLTTVELPLEVTKGSTAAPHSQSSTAGDPGKTAFIRVSVPKERAYVGEIIPVTIKAYFLRGIRAEVMQLPQIMGEAFVISPLSSEPQQTLEAHDGRQYSVISWESTLSPIKEGTYDLAMNLGTTLLLPQKNPRSRMNRDPLFSDDFFTDDFFDSFFGSFQKKNILLRSIPLSFSVIALPEEGKPDNFSGAIGSFDFSVTAIPLDVKVGDPITLTMTVSGRGNFDRVSPPDFPAGQSWKTYTATADFLPEGSNTEGKKVFEQAVVANNSTITAVPQLVFSYFDPIDEKYVSKTTDPLPLKIIREVPVAAGSSTPQQQAVQQPTSPDLLPQSATIRLAQGTFVTEIRPVYSKAWFILVAACCTLLLILLITLSLWKTYCNRNSAKIRQKHLNREIAAKMAALKHTINHEKKDEFFTDCRHIIQDYLGNLWGVEPSAITLADLQQRLPSTSPLLRVFETAERSAYGGTTVSINELDEYYTFLQQEMEKKS